MVLLLVSGLGSPRMWICKVRGILAYEIERQRCELDSRHFGTK